MTATKQKRMQKLEAQAEELSKQHPEGTPCRYWPIEKQGELFGEYKTTEVASGFFVMSGHSVCVFVKGVSGCVAASHLTYDMQPTS